MTPDEEPTRFDQKPTKFEQGHGDPPPKPAPAEEDKGSATR